MAQRFRPLALRAAGLLAAAFVRLWCGGFLPPGLVAVAFLGAAAFFAGALASTFSAFFAAG